MAGEWQARMATQSRFNALMNERQSIREQNESIRQESLDRQISRRNELNQMITDAYQPGHALPNELAGPRTEPSLDMDQVYGNMIQGGRGMDAINLQQVMRNKKIEEINRRGEINQQMMQDFSGQGLTPGQSMKITPKGPEFTIDPAKAVKSRLAQDKALYERGGETPRGLSPKGVYSNLPPKMQDELRSMQSKESIKLSSKDYQELISGAKKVEEQKSLAEEALQQFRKYSNKSMAGTGPFASGFGLKKYVDADTQKMEAIFRTINLKNMAATFAGMSRAIDTDAERRAWEQTQPGITLDDPVNFQILVGSISMATKAEAESNARRTYIDQSQDGTLRGYRSPVFGKTKTMFNQNGEATVVPNDEVQDAINNGLFTSDQYTEMLTNDKVRDMAGITETGQVIDKGELKIGTVKDGYVYNGGDPANPNSWTQQ